MSDLLLLLPEIYLAITLVFIIASEVAYHGEPMRLTTGMAVLGLSGAFIQTLLTFRAAPAQALGHALSVDGLSLFFKLFFTLLGALAILAARETREMSKGNWTEFCALVVGSCLAMCIASSATDVLLAFLALQFLNVLGFLLAGFSKSSLRSTEAAIKHLTFGAVSAFLFLFAVAILFASTGTISIHEMHQLLVQNPLPREAALVVFMLLLLSLGFQMAAFPMSLASPDVIEGAPTPVSGFLSLAPRVAGFAVAIRFILVIFAQPALNPGQWQVLGVLDWPKIAGLIAGLTMVSGALLALRQTSAKRLVAYLAVAESGFLLMGLLVLDQVGVAALLFNCLVQLFALIGSFTVLSHIHDEIKSDRLADLKGLSLQAVPESIALILFLSCLVGLPPLPGFVGKFTLVGAAIRHHWNALAALAILSSALATVGLARLAYSLVGDLRQLRVGALGAAVQPRRVFLAALFVPMVLVGIFAEPLLVWAAQSLRFILW
jgi:NADH-quinone oxidoreductase subunit N